MESTIEKTCLLIQELTHGTLNNLEELSSGYLIPELLLKIDPIYFEKCQGVKNWYQYK